MKALALLLVLCASASTAKPKDQALIEQDITIKGRGAAGPAVQVPEPTADAAVLKEVERSLDIYNEEQKTQAAPVSLETTLRRLAQPFPEAPFLTFAPRSAGRMDRWQFQVLEDGIAIWHTEGAGRLSQRLDWDGANAAGEMTARVGPEYRFRFTGRRGADDLALESEPIRLRSLAFKEFMGEQHLEVDNTLLFVPGKASFAATAADYLNELSRRMRRSVLKDRPYHLVLFQADPQAKLAVARANALKTHFAKQLVIARARVSVDLQTSGRRGDVTACVLPPEKGAAIRE